MFDDLKFAPKDEDEMEDFRDYGDEGDEVDSKLDDYEDDEDEDVDEDVLGKLTAAVAVAPPPPEVVWSLLSKIWVEKSRRPKRRRLASP